MDCNKLREILTDYIYGELSAVEAGEAEKHLAECPACRKQVEELRGVLHVYRDSPKPAAPQKRLGKALKEASRIRQKEVEDKRRKRVVRPSMLRRLAFHPVSLAAAMIAIVFAVLLDQWESPEVYQQRKGNELDMAIKDDSTTLDVNPKRKKDNSGPLMPVEKKAEESVASAAKETKELEAMPTPDRDITIPPALENGAGEAARYTIKDKSKTAISGDSELQQKPEALSWLTKKIQTADNGKTDSNALDNKDIAPKMTLPDRETGTETVATAPVPGVTIPEPKLPLIGQREVAVPPPPPVKNLEIEGLPERGANITKEETTAEEPVREMPRPITETDEAPVTDEEVADFADDAATVALEENVSTPATNGEAKTLGWGGAAIKAEADVKAHTQPEGQESAAIKPSEADAATITSNRAEEIATTETTTTRDEARQRTLVEVEELVRRAEEEGRFGADTMVSAEEAENEEPPAREIIAREIDALDRRGKVVRLQSNNNLTGAMQNNAGKKSTETVTVSQDWSATVNGLQAHITLEENTYAPATPIVVQYQVRNAGEEKMQVFIAGFWPNHRVDVFNADGELAELTPAGIRRREVFAPEAERGKDAAMPMEPGEVDRDLPPVDLRDLYVLDKPGTYLVRYIYQEKQAEGWSGKLPSNTLQFEILPE